MENGLFKFDGIITDTLNNRTRSVAASAQLDTIYRRNDLERGNAPDNLSMLTLCEQLEAALASSMNEELTVVKENVFQILYTALHFAQQLADALDVPDPILDVQSINDIVVLQHMAPDDSPYTLLIDSGIEYLLGHRQIDDIVSRYIGEVSPCKELQVETSAMIGLFLRAYEYGHELRQFHIGMEA